MTRRRNRLFAAAVLVMVGVYLFWPQQVITCAAFAGFGAEVQGDRCIVLGDLTLEGAVDSLPAHLVVKGDLTINGTYIDRLPIGLIVEGDLNLYKTSIGALPENLIVVGSFTNYLGFGSPDLWCAEIPASVVIHGQNLGCSP